MELTIEELKEDLITVIQRNNDFEVLNYVYDIFKDEGYTSEIDYIRFIKQFEIEMKLFDNVMDELSNKHEVYEEINQLKERYQDLINKIRT